MVKIDRSDFYGMVLIFTMAAVPMADVRGRCSRKFLRMMVREHQFCAASNHGILEK
jgi:hypothetical protein